MRRALLKRLPALTRFTYGAIHPLTVEDYTLAELTEYLRAMDVHNAEQARLRDAQEQLIAQRIR